VPRQRRGREKWIEVEEKRESQLVVFVLLVAGGSSGYV
jgi:hypothetical protein